MANITSKIKQYCKANNINNVNFLTDVRVADNDIMEWNLDIAKPTDAQLSAVEDDADKMERNETVDTTRIKAYGNLADQLDEIYHDIDAWRTRIAQIKSDNPKEE